jgi:chemotaxis protein CheY-P-specific phosphatase CheC
MIIEVRKMNADDNALLVKVFFSIFEDFAFMFGEEALETENKNYKDFFRAKITFKSKSKKGFIEIIAPSEFCDEIAENILGDDVEELPEYAGESALKELLNISCGYFLTEKFEKNEIFDLSIPETSAVAAKEWNLLLCDRNHTMLLVEESPVLARFFHTLIRRLP